MHGLLSVASLVVLFGQAMGQVAVWGQCGGTGYAGSTTCASGSTCTYSNPYYSQCIPGSSSSVSSSSTRPTTTTTGPTSTTTTGGVAPTGSLPPVGYNQLRNWGSNPTNIEIFSYRPKQLAASPAVLLALHPCGGTAQMYYTSTTYAQLAETYGYYILFGDSNRSQMCWDVNTNETLPVHNGGGDALGLANAVRYSIANWGVPASKAFVTGSSSGAMMTNVMAAVYPDLFTGAAVDSGVPFGCWAGPNTQSACPRGQDIRTPSAWGDVVRAAYPGYTGARPNVQLYHGTADNLLYPQNFFEEIKEWTNVFGYSQTPVSNTTIPGYPSSYSNATYGPKLQAILAQGVGHYVPVAEDLILKFFHIE